MIGPLYAAFGVACALARARLTGEGCYLDVSCADAVLGAKWLDAIPMLNPELVDRSWAGEGPGRVRQVPALRDGRRQVRPLLRDRGEVLGALVHGGRPRGPPGRAPHRSRRRLRRRRRRAAPRDPAGLPHEDAGRMDEDRGRARHRARSRAALRRDRRRSAPAGTRSGRRRAAPGLRRRPHARQPDPRPRRGVHRAVRARARPAHRRGARGARATTRPARAHLHDLGVV